MQRQCGEVREGNAATAGCDTDGEADKRGECNEPDADRDRGGLCQHEARALDRMREGQRQDAGSSSPAVDVVATEIPM